ncbi:hypothetical protein [Streptomyces caatingaensis]|uniref:hypothetical protein n=1 Tax=Streptomyces caatingaensis TaxID=1678637 RepID=UPI000A4FF33B|nr:hypothetical protein [Streptomyces caatingaensis]
MPWGGALTGIGLLATCLAAGTTAPADQAVPLLPGLLLYGFGGGIVATSLTGLTLAGVSPADTGAASGGLLTAVQSSEAIGVAGIGAFYGASAASGGYAHGFLVSVAVLAGLSVPVTVLLRVLRPRVRERSGGGEAGGRRR